MNAIPNLQTKVLKDLEEIDKQEEETQEQQKSRSNFKKDVEKREQKRANEKQYKIDQQHNHNASIDTKIVNDLLKELDLFDSKNNNNNNNNGNIGQQSFVNSHHQQQNQKSTFFNPFDKDMSMLRMPTQMNNKTDLQLSMIQQQLLHDHFLNSSIIQNTTMNHINQNQNNKDHQNSNFDDIDQFLRQFDDNNETVLYSSNLLNNTDVLR